MSEKKFTDQIVAALLHFLYNFFVYFLFLTPLDLWKKATVRLAEQREKSTLNITKIIGLWPFLSFLKAFILEFLIDGLIFFSYFIGPIVAIFYMIKGGGEFSGLVIILIGTYYYPVGFSLIRDFLQLMILPFRKFLSWASKPAQYMDLEIKNK